MQYLLFEPSVVLVWRALEEHPVSREDSDAETVEFLGVGGSHLNDFNLNLINV